MSFTDSGKTQQVNMLKTPARLITLRESLYLPLYCIGSSKTKKAGLLPCKKNDQDYS